MRLYFLRHGIAEEARYDLPDEARRLTPDGIAEMRAMAAALKRMDLKLDLILTSPRLRALETAQIVAEALKMSVHEDDRLSGGCGLGDLQQIVSDHSGAKRLMLVGHEPDMSSLAGRLIGGAILDVKKGGLVRVEVERVEPGGGVLEWLLTPAVLVQS